VKIITTHEKNCPDCPLGDLLGHGAEVVPAEPAQVRVRDLIAPGRQVWCAGDRPSLAEAGDRLLYLAARDVLPEYQAAGRSWRSDLVRYLPGVLPGGELHRSIGHWNHPGQLEAFEVIEGRVGLFIGSPDGDVFYSEAEPGDVLALPPGAWHLTYVLGSGAVVFNVYADESANGQADKYAGPPPVRHWLRDTASGPVPQPPPGDRTAEICPAAQWRPDIPAGAPCLAAKLASPHGAAADLTAIRAMAERGWPAITKER
jgi:quercetin dioxygenase-like cupin family protein